MHPRSVPTSIFGLDVSPWSGVAAFDGFSVGDRLVEKWMFGIQHVVRVQLLCIFFRIGPSAIYTLTPMGG